jgi:hypothetical protein
MFSSKEMERAFAPTPPHSGVDYPIFHYLAREVVCSKVQV